MKTKLSILVCLLIMQFAAKAQMKIGDNSTTINTASLLELESTNKGLVFPRISLTSTTASTPLPSTLLTGTVVYNTNASATGGNGVGLYVWDGSAWQSLASGTAVSALAWSLVGNAATNSAVNFLGTTDNHPLKFKVNNTLGGYIDSSGGAGNAFLGYTAGSGITSGTHNTAMGHQALSLNTTTSNNTAFGYQSLQNNVGTGNTAAGYSSMLTNTTGQYNAAFGFSALKNNTTGSYNVAVGQSALQNNTTGANNAVVGEDGLLNNTTGRYLAGLGTNALYGNTTGNYNVGVGESSLYTNTTGASNIAVGAYSLFSSTTASNNIAFGYYAGGFTTTGASNVFIGNQSGINNVTGARNTLIGVNTDVLNNSISNSAAIGYNTKVGLNNSLVLGDTISGGYAMNVGIGVRSPIKRLHIDAANLASSTQNDSLKIDHLAASFSPYNKSILVIDSATGYVSRQSVNTLAAGNYWSLTGNSGTNYATNFLGTTDNTSLRFRTNNTERMVIDSLGSVGIGSTSFNTNLREKLLVDYGNTTSNNIASFTGSINDYLQIGVQNKSNGINASSDIVATADDGTDSTNYIDMGINGSGYTPSVENFGGPHDGYLYSNSRNLIIGTQKPSSDLIFLAGGGVAKVNTVLRIDGPTGNIIVGKGEASTAAIGNTVRGPSGAGTNIAGGSLALMGGNGTGTAAAGSLTLSGGTTGTGTAGNIVMNTSASERLRIDPSGNVGIGTTNPGYKLSVLAASNPLYLSGVQATSTFTADSILTINAGVVKKTAYSSLNGGLNWSITGNAATSAGTNSIGYTANGNFIGTTDAANLVVATNNIKRMVFDQNGNAYGGRAGTNIASSANGSFAWGDSNLVYGNNSLVVGNTNIDSSKNSFVFGNGNVLGAGGVQTNRGTLVGGGGNVVTGGQSYNSIINGSQNTLSGDNFESFVTGFANSVTSSQKVIVSGQGNAVSGTAFSTVSGGFNTLSSAAYANIFGGGNTINSGAAYGVTIGQSNVIAANHANAMALGKSVTTTTAAQFAANFSGGYNLFTTTGATTAAIPSLAITSAGNVGIGTSAPSNALSVLAASNPLYLSGVQATSTFSSDSILTISAGVVKKAPYTSLPSSGSAWLLTGNSITSGQFLGTTNALPLVLKSNNAQIGYFDGNLGSIALGAGAVNNTSDHNIAIGYNASTNNQYTLALGYQASATGVRSVAIGNGNTPLASGAEAIAIGYGANATNSQAIAMGYNAQATGAYNAASGYDAQATGANDAIAIGRASRATQTYSTAIGYSAQATGAQSTAIGYQAQTSQANTILLGNAALGNLYVGIGTATPTAKLHIVGGTTTNYPLQMTGLPTGTTGTDNILTINSSGVVGYVTPANFNSAYWGLNGNAAVSGNFLGTTNSTPLLFKFNNTSSGYLDANNTSFGTSSTATSGTLNTAIGYSANAANGSTAVGASSVTSAANNTAVGNSATANNSTQETAIGASAQATAQYNTALGYNAQAISNSQATAIGTTAKANAILATALGYNAQAISNGQTTAVGSNSQANAQYNTAVGYNAQSVSNSYGTALGTNSNTTGQYATALGAESDATFQYSTAVGYNAQATVNNQSTAIGANTSATGTNSTAIGYGATTSQANAIVIGTSSNNVGIGTSNPSNALSVLATSNPLYLSGVQATSTFSADSLLTINAGVVKKTAFSSLNGGLNWSTTGNAGTTAGTNYIGTSDNVDFVAKTNAAERLRITAGGNIGIGTTAPLAPLDFGNSALGNKLFLWQGSTTSSYGFGIQNNLVQMFAATGANIGFGTGASGSFTEAMRVSSGGNVGIGTTAPNNKLEITQGTAGNSGLRFTNLTSASTGTAASTTADQILTVNASGDVIMTNGLNYVNTQTGAYTLTAADNQVIVYITSGSAVTITVPNTLPAGFTCAVIQGGAGQLTFAGTGLQNAYSQFKTPNQYASTTIQTPITGTNVLSGQTSW